MTALQAATTGRNDASPEAQAMLRGPERMASTGWRWSYVRWTAFAAYALGMAIFIHVQGIPTDRLGIYAAILIVLSIVVLGRGWAAWWQMMIDWLPFQLVLIAYDYSRGLASPYSDAQVQTATYPIHGVRNALGLPLHVEFPIHFDNWLGMHLGMGGMPTTWVQEHLHPTTAIPWYGALVSLVYVSHFLVMPIVAIVLWIRNRSRFVVWMRMVVVLAVAGVATYFVYPMAPPWLADDGDVFPGPVVGRYTSQGFDLIGMHMVGGIISQGQYLVNPVAAMPSLHTAYATLAAAFFWFGKRWWQKALLACYPIAMGFALVYGGEHYVVDEIAGAAYALAVISGWRILRARRIRREAAAAADVPEEPELIESSA
ncbi:MAG: inositol phosphorylceramide synthase [Nocardioides sp.]|nr:inositol phosphorylceramide synthase [Nocardioides sp.]